MILGIGIDTVEIARIEKAYQEHGEKFLQRLFLPSEIAYALSHARPAIPLSARFSAKEALSKAMGTGIGLEINFLDAEVVKDALGKPNLITHGKAKQWLEERGVKTLHLSLTHTATHASAFVILEQ
jgi:holo-[acyl-carrier protein] synthase